MQSAPSPPIETQAFDHAHIPSVCPWGPSSRCLRSPRHRLPLRDKSHQAKARTVKFSKRPKKKV
eukprot:3413096-Amphidinium_carterae.1